MKVAIIGTRDPSPSQSQAANQLAKNLSENGVTITTGAADGIDTDAMRGALPGFLRVYLPWATYNKENIPFHAQRTIYDPIAHHTWLDSVRLHPAATHLTRGALKLHARNYGILMDEEPADACVAFPNTTGGGGTAQGIRIARAMKIPLMVLPKNVPFGYQTLLLWAESRLQLPQPNEVGEKILDFLNRGRKAQAEIDEVLRQANSEE